MKRFSLLLFLILSLFGTAQAKEKIVFVINTGEFDEGGGNILGATYLIDHDYVQAWQKLYPEAKIVRIRANTNSEVTKYLEMWMQADPSEKEVAGLFIHSHGNFMTIANESDQFMIDLWSGLSKVFKPLYGKFSKNARIVFNGCSLLSGMQLDDAEQALASMAHQFGLTSGLIYANRTLGFSGTNAYTKINVFNPDVNLKSKVLAIASSPGMVVLLPLFAYLEFYRFNKGYALILSDKPRKVLETTFHAVMKPSK